MPRRKSFVELCRINLYIPVETKEWLETESARLGTTLSEFIRRMFDEKRLRMFDEKRFSNKGEK